VIGILIPIRAGMAARP